MYLIEKKIIVRLYCKFEILDNNNFHVYLYLAKVDLPTLWSGILVFAKKFPCQVSSMNC